MQGYPDNWTKYGADGTEIADTARYRAIGNSICVFCAERVYLGILDALTEVSGKGRCLDCKKPMGLAYNPETDTMQADKWELVHNEEM